jgi:hypothetical protein
MDTEVSKSIKKFVLDFLSCHLTGTNLNILPGDSVLMYR